MIYLNPALLSKRADDPPPEDQLPPQKNFLGLDVLPTEYGLMQGMEDIKAWFGGQGDASKAASNRALAYFAPRLAGAVGLGGLAAILAGRKGGLMVPLLGAIGGFIVAGPLMDMLQKAFGSKPQPPPQEPADTSNPTTQEIAGSRDKLGKNDPTDPNDKSMEVKFTLDQQQLRTELSPEMQKELDTMSPAQQQAALQSIIDSLNDDARAALQQRANENTDLMTPLENADFHNYQVLNEMRQKADEERLLNGRIDEQINGMDATQLEAMLDDNMKQQLASQNFATPEERTQAMRELVRDTVKSNIMQQDEDAVSQLEGNLASSLSDEDKNMIVRRELAKMPFQEQKEFAALPVEEQQKRADEILNKAVHQSAVDQIGINNRKPPMTDQEREQALLYQLGKAKDPQKALEVYQNASPEEKEQMLYEMVDLPYQQMNDAFEQSQNMIMLTRGNVAGTQNRVEGDTPFYDYTDYGFVKSDDNPNGIDINTVEGQKLADKIMRGEIDPKEAAQYYKLDIPDPNANGGWLRWLNPHGDISYNQELARADEDRLKRVTEEMAGYKDKLNSRQPMLNPTNRYSYLGEMTDDRRAMFHNMYEQMQKSAAERGFKLPYSEEEMIARWTKLGETNKDRLLGFDTGIIQRDPETNLLTESSDKAFDAFTTFQDEERGRMAAAKAEAEKQAAAKAEAAKAKAPVNTGNPMIDRMVNDPMGYMLDPYNIRGRLGLSAPQNPYQTYLQYTQGTRGQQTQQGQGGPVRPAAPQPADQPAAAPAAQPESAKPAAPAPQNGGSSNVSAPNPGKDVRTPVDGKAAATPVSKDKILGAK